jgi:hypothetical protein
VVDVLQGEKECLRTSSPSHATRCGGIPTMCHPTRESGRRESLALTSDISEGGHAQLPSVITPLVIWIERQ